MDQLQPVSAGDSEFLFQLFAGTRADELAGLDWSAEQKQAFLKMQFNAQSESYRIQFPQAVHYLILRAGTRIGHLIVDRSDCLRLVDIALLPAYRHAGIGTALLRDLQTQAASSHQPIQLAVDRNNPARRLYERLGFSTIATGTFYLEMEWQPL